MKDFSMPTAHYTTTSAILAPAAAVQIIPANTNRASLMLQVTGTAPATFGFGVAPVAGQGLSLDGASVAGGQGGSRLWELSSNDHVPYDAIWAISTVGTTIVVIEGVNGP
jgi:hypothetical protein